MFGPTVSNESRYAFWSDSSISDALLFVTADYASGADLGHRGSLRYIVSTYIRRPPDADEMVYFLEDRYMTFRRYDVDYAKEDVLASEKQEILARLRRAKAENERPVREPH